MFFFNCLKKSYHFWSFEIHKGVLWDYWHKNVVEVNTRDKTINKQTSKQTLRALPVPLTSKLKSPIVRFISSLMWMTKIKPKESEVRLTSVCTLGLDHIFRGLETFVYGSSHCSKLVWHFSINST